MKNIKTFELFSFKKKPKEEVVKPEASSLEEYTPAYRWKRLEVSIDTEGSTLNKIKRMLQNGNFKISKSSNRNVARFKPTSDDIFFHESHPDGIIFEIYKEESVTGRHSSTTHYYISIESNKIDDIIIEESIKSNGRYIEVGFGEKLIDILDKKMAIFEIPKLEYKRLLKLLNDEW
jgi:hypothetical protein